MKFKKLTNLDISNLHRNKKYWLMKSDFMSAFSYWLVSQSPYNAPDITNALIAFEKYVDKKIVKDNKVIGLRYNQLKKLINEKVFENIQEIEIFNHPKIDTGATIMFSSRYDQPKPDYDFVDLGALARNIFYMILREQIVN